MSDTFYYIYCVPDRSWLSKIGGQADEFSRDRGRALEISEVRAKALGYRKSDPIYRMLEVPERCGIGIAFDPQRKADIHGVSDGTEPNGEKAERGKAVVALCYLLSQPESSYRKLQTRLMEQANGVDLTEEPERPLADMLTDIMHYCHKERIEFGETYQTACKHFQVESGGASL